MSKDEILNILNNYNFDKSKYILLSGAALTLYGIKDKTNDIDIAISKDYFKCLLNNYNSKLSYYNKDTNANIYEIDNIIEFSTNFYQENYNNKDYNIIDGIMVQSLSSIIKLKQRLKREKDLKDLKLIYEYISQNIQDYDSGKEEVMKVI